MSRTVVTGGAGFLGSHLEPVVPIEGGLARTITYFREHAELLAAAPLPAPAF